MAQKDAAEPFNERLRAVQRGRGTVLCVGLDVDPRRLPEGLDRNRAGIERFARGIIDATSDLVCAYKPNLAFFEALGDDGPALLRAALRAIPDGILTIADGKRGDIDTSAERYAAALFEVLGFDAATVSPYQGFDSVEPFLRDGARGAFVLCKTSNPGGRDFQDLVCDDGGKPARLFEVVARRAVEWNRHENVGLVAGVTFPEELRRIRELAPDLPLLVLGVGSQGGDADAALRLGAAADGTLVVVSVSRLVLYASSGEDWAQAARRQALALHQVLRVPAGSR